MSLSAQMFTAIIDTADHFDNGEPVRAREVFADAIATIATPGEITAMMAVAAAFERYKYQDAVRYLRSVQKHHPEHSMLVSVCLPHSDPRLHRDPATVPAGPAAEDESGPMWITTRSSEWFAATAPRRGSVKLQHPDVFYRRPNAATRLAEAKATHPARIAALRSARRPQVVEPGVVENYFATRYRVDEDPTHLPVPADHVGDDTEPAYPIIPEVPEAYAIDFDNAAMYPVTGWRCVSCFIERAVNDARRIDPATGQRRNDDGLCDSCRDAGMPGVAALPAWFGWDDEVAAICAHFAGTYPGAARALLRDQFRRSPLYVRAVIAAWVAAHPLASPDRRPALDEPDHAAATESVQTSAA